MSASDVLTRPQPTVGAPPLLPSELVPGLLLFFARPSMLQTWAEFFGHEWRHVGVTIETAEGLRIASYGPRKCYRLDDPTEIMSAYTRVGVARIFQSDADVEAIESFCRTFEHLDRSDAPYTFSGVLIGPVHLAARRRRPGPMRSLLFAIVYLYCLMQQARYNDRGAYGCSTFVWAVVDIVRSDLLRLPLSAHPDDEAAYATPSTKRDKLFARWLCGPTELWQAISPASRGDLDLSEFATDPAAPAVSSSDDIVIDLTQEPAVVSAGEVVIDLTQEPAVVSEPVALVETAGNIRKCVATVAAGCHFVASGPLNLRKAEQSVR